MRSRLRAMSHGCAPRRQRANDDRGELRTISRRVRAATAVYLCDLMAGSTGLEPATSGLTVQCANQAAPRARFRNQLLSERDFTITPRDVPGNVPASFWTAAWRSAPLTTA